MKIKKLITIFAILTGSFVAFGQAAPATDAAATEQSEAQKGPQVKNKTFGEIWAAGGITMYPLGFLSIAGIALVIYNFISLRKKKYLLPDGVPELEKKLNALDLEGARKYCEDHPAPITNIIGTGLSRVYGKDVDIDAVNAAMEEASMEELAAPYTLISYISVIATIPPMLGLYGTVSGMVKAFDTIAAEGAGSAQRLAGNISEALITTAAGMIIGIPAMVFFFYFKNKFANITSGIGRIVGDLLFTMQVSLKYGPQELDNGNEAPKAEEQK